MPNNTFALIVGIDHYDNDDIGDLKGSCNDAVHWYRLCRRFLGIPAEQITVLSSPPLKASDLGDGADKSVLGAADRAAILAAAEALGKALSKGGAEGLVTYSGHGVVAGHSSQEIEGADLAICPEDVARQPDGSFDRVIRFGELAEVFTRLGVRDALTVFFDTCYTGSVDADAPPARHLLGNQASPVADAVKKALAAEADAVMASRLILGARHWKPAYEVRTGSGYRGAASFAMTTLLQQWSTKSADGVTYFNVSYGDLIHRARRVIEALGFDQQPFMWGPRELDDLPVLKHGLAINPGETSETPDGQKDDRQIPVDIRQVAYLITIDQGTTWCLKGLITGRMTSLPSGYSGWTEYWVVNNSNLPNGRADLSLTVTNSGQTSEVRNFVSGWTSGDTQYYCSKAQSDGWTKYTTKAQSGCLYYAAFTIGTHSYPIGFYVDATAASGTYGTINNISWYVYTISGDAAPTTGTSVFSNMADCLTLKPVTTSNDPTSIPNQPKTGVTWYFSN